MANAALWQGDTGALLGPDVTAKGLMPAERPEMSGGMFAGGRRRGVDWARLGAMILAANNNPLGTMLMRQHADTDESMRTAEARERQRLQSLEDQRQQWLWQQQWQRDNPAPTEFERSLRAAGIDPNSEEGRNLARQRAMNQANPMTAIDVTMPDGSTQRQWIRPPTGGAPATPQGPQPGAIEDGYRFRGGDPADPNSWEPVQGGATQPGSRPFR